MRVVRNIASTMLPATLRKSKKDSANLESPLRESAGSSFITTIIIYIYDIA